MATDGVTDNRGRAGRWLEASDMGIKSLSLAIGIAFQANASTIYPEGADGPDPGALAEVAARAAWAYFLEIIQGADDRKEKANG